MSGSHFSQNKRKCVGLRDLDLDDTHHILCECGLVGLTYGCYADVYSPRNQILNALLRSAEVYILVSWNILCTHKSKVVLINDGPFSGKIAVIAEIIDHNRVSATRRALLPPQLKKFQAIIDGPSTGVPRQVFPYKHILLTPIKLTKLPRGAGSGVIRKLVEQEAIVEKWDKSAWAQKRVTREKRKDLNDFDRFKVMLAKKQRRDQVRKALKASV